MQIQAAIYLSTEVSDSTAAKLNQDTTNIVFNSVDLSLDQKMYTTDLKGRYTQKFCHHSFVVAYSLK